MAGDYFCIELDESLIRVGDVRREGQLFASDQMGSVETLPMFLSGESEKIIEQQAANLYSLLNHLGIKKKVVNVIMPDSYTYSQITSMPKLNEKEMLSAIKFQADQFVPMPLDDTNLDIELLHEDVQKKSMLTLIAAAPKRLIAKIERLLDILALEPEAIETQISAVGRVASEIIRIVPQQGAVSYGVLFINFGLTSTSLYFFNQSLGIFTYSHNFSIGYNLFSREIQVNLNVDQKKSVELLRAFGLSQTASYKLDAILSAGIKDFLSEIQRSINELQDRYQSQVKEIFIFNEIDRFHSFEKIVGSYFGLSSQIMNLYPYFVKNTVVEALKNNLGSYISVVGGNLR